jgi:hypothetical protein
LQSELALWDSIAGDGLNDKWNDQQ